MEIGKVIREQRKLLGLTQEQIAVRLGVSTPAVNKWENNNAYPDFVLLSPLARLLDIDVNTLVGFYQNLTRKEIGDMVNEVAKLAHESGFEPAFKLAKEHINKNPSCHLLLLSLGQVLSGCMIMYPSVGDKEGWQAELDSWIEEASKSEDSQTSLAALSYMVTIYINREEFDRAELVLERIPEPSIDKESLTNMLYMRRGDYDRAYEGYQRKLLRILNSLCNTLSEYTQLYLKRDEPQKAEKIALLYQQTVSLYGLPMYFDKLPLLLSAMEEKDREKVWRLMKEFVEYIENMSDPSNLQKEESLLFSCIEFKKSTDYHVILDSLVKGLQMDEDSAYLREDPDFEQRLKSLFPNVE